LIIVQSTYNNIFLNVYKSFFVGILLLVLSLNPSSLFAYEHYDEVLERGVLSSMEAMRTFQVHYTNWMHYTLNISTPGFIEQGVYNTREHIGQNVNGVEEYEINIKPFYRWRAGPMVETNNKLDFYIDANSRGFFVILLPSGNLAYTRDGRFRIDSEGRLVTLQNSYPVLGDGGQIVFPEPTDDIVVSRAGLIFADGQPLSKIKISVFRSFTEMQTLDDLNGSFFVMTEPIEVIEGAENYVIVQGAIEQNNVLKAVTGDILTAKNGYETSLKVAQLINRALSTAAGLAAP